MRAPIGVFGGAFAPFHNGHLRLAIEARDQLSLSELRLVPTAQPPHRAGSRVSPQRRLEWVQAAVRGERGLVADDCEIQRPTTSYTVETLAELREQQPSAPLVLLIGADAFRYFHLWHQWERILELAHLAVAARPGTELRPPAEIAAALAGREIADPGLLQTSLSGHWLCLPLPVLDISSTRIRHLLKQRRSVRGLVPDAIVQSMTAADIAALTQEDDAKTH